MLFKTLYQLFVLRISLKLNSFSRHSKLSDSLSVHQRSGNTDGYLKLFFISGPGKLSDSLAIHQRSGNTDGYIDLCLSHAASKGINNNWDSY